MTDQVPQEGQPSAESVKRATKARPVITDSFMMACCASRPADSLAGILVRALSSLRIPPIAVDEALGVPDGTVRTYLKEGIGLEDSAVEPLLYGLALAKNSGALEPKLPLVDVIVKLAIVAGTQHLQATSA